MVSPPTQPDALLSWMECLADDARLRLLRLLERHELGVAELCDVLQLPQSTVSRHLKMLSEQGWTVSRRQGTAHLYRMILDELEPPARKLWLVAREQIASWATSTQDERRLQRLLQDKQTESQAFFAGAAARWDKLRDELYGRAFSVSALLAFLPRHWTVADLACGTGPVSGALAAQVARVLAVDNSPAMLKAARARLAGADNVELRKGDLEALPIEDAACDAAVLLLALTYTPAPAAALREMARILKPGGRAVICDMLPHDREDFRREMGQQTRGFDPLTVEQLLTESGLASARCVPLPAEPGVKGPALFLATADRPAAF